MSKSKVVWVPAVAVTIIALLFLVYSFTMPHVRREFSSASEWFNNVGTLAVWLGAASFIWLFFKTRRKSKLNALKSASKWIYTIHKAAGYAALAAILAHGVYFLFFSTMKPETFTGLAAFAVTVGISAYGILIPKIRNVYMRAVHRYLGIVWIPFLFIHAGGSAILCTILLAAACFLIWLAERRSAVKPSAAG